jgi:hypothetical protein
MKNVFRELKSWAEEQDIEVQIDSTYYEYAKTKQEDRIVNGLAGSDGYITLYVDGNRIEESWDYLTSMLIHEIGHVLLFQDGKGWHTEKQAWICGIRTVPKRFHPKTLEQHCIECLKTYNYKRFGWIKTLLS